MLLKFPVKYRALAALIFSQFLLYPLAFASDCSDAISLGNEVYRYARKAYLESSFEDAQEYARKARNLAADAKSEANNCGCDDAESCFDDAYTFARKAYNASDLDELNTYAKKAMRAAEDGIAAAEACSRR